MSNRLTHDLACVVGKYTKDGQEKNRYVNIGKAFTDDEGRISLKLETIPCSPDWNGWVSLFPVKKRDGQQDRLPDDSPEVPF